MKDISTAVVLFFLGLFVFTKFVGPLPLSINSVTTQKTDLFSVTGEGKVTMIPDIAVVSLGVTAQGATVSMVQNELNKKINAATDSVKKQGVNAQDIKTTNYSINPTYDYAGNTQRITGYQANATLAVKVRKMDSVNSVVDAATAQGVNEVGGISFDVDDKTKAEADARTLAVKDAKTKAEEAAKTAGFSLGRIVNYTEGTNNTPRPLYMMGKSLPVAGGGDGAPTQVEPGSSEITISVTLSYELK